MEFDQLAQGSAVDSCLQQLLTALEVHTAKLRLHLSAVLGAAAVASIAPCPHCLAPGQGPQTPSHLTVTHVSAMCAISGRDSLPSCLQFVAEKTEYALSKGLKVILCVGETLEVREANQTFDVIAQQVKPVAGKVKDWSNVVIAYEPVWAIGTGKVASKEQVSLLYNTLGHSMPALQQCCSFHASSTTVLLIPCQLYNSVAHSMPA